MILQVMRECRRFFEVSAETGEFEIKDGEINLRGGYAAGQYIAVTGSVLNNGVYLINGAPYALEGAKDEVFCGTIYGLAVPPDFLALCGEIGEFVKKDGNSSFKSENVRGVHSWSRATKKSGAPVDWQTVFAARLAPFRRMFTEVAL